MKSWLSHLKGLDASIPHHVGKGAKKIVIHHDADGDDDGTYEKFEININDPEGAEKLKTNARESGLITGAKCFLLCREILKSIYMNLHSSLIILFLFSSKSVLKKVLER